jgi:hypothetical protein
MEKKKQIGKCFDFKNTFSTFAVLPDGSGWLDFHRAVG